MYWGLYDRSTKNYYIFFTWTFITWFFKIFIIILIFFIKDIVDRLVSDSIQEVIKVMENILEEANSTKEKNLQKYSWEKYIRFWKMMKILVENENVSRLSLIYQIFKDNPSELDFYETINIINFIENNPFSLTINNVDNKNINQNHQQNNNQNNLNDNNLNIIDIFISNKFKELKEKLESVVVIPSLPRMKIAFKLILNNPFLKEQSERIEKNLKKIDLKDDKKELNQELEKLFVRRKDLIHEQLKFVENSSTVTIFFF